MTIKYNEMSLLDVSEVSKLYTKLLCFIRNEVHDDYFDFLEPSPKDLCDKLDIFIKN